MGRFGLEKVTLVIIIASELCKSSIKRLNMNHPCGAKGSLRYTSPF